MTLKPLLALVVAVSSVLVLTATTAPANAGTSAVPLPVLGIPPAGANDWTCQPTAERPDPAVIVHGTFGDQKSLLDNLSLALKKDGYCVYALDYGNRATGPIADSAAQLKTFVDKVLASTGAAKVEMVGHSQGGMMPRYYIKNLGGGPEVEDLVGLAPSNHGTYNAALLNPTATFCYSCAQQASDSAFLKELNSPDETPGDVDYTQIETSNDEVVVPYTSAFLSGPRSTNILLQDRCPATVSEHLLIPMDPQAISWVLDAFDRAGPADPQARVGCH
jgi:triacylglycerol esterase/lipase EstA (alpha/beta hydrolase family)